MEAEERQTINFASDGFIKDSLERIIQGGPGTNLVVGELNRHLRVNKKPLDRNLVEVSVINLDGVVVSSTNKEAIGMDMSSDTDFLYIQQDRETTRIKQPFHYPQTEEGCLSILTIVTSKAFHERLGVLVNTVRLEALSDITCEWTGMGETGEVYLVNSEGIMLTESRFMEGTPLKQIVDTEPVRRATRGEEMSGIYKNYMGTPVVGTSMHLPRYGWTLLTEMSTAEAFAPLRVLAIAALVMGLVSAAAVVGVGIIFALSISGDIRRLTEATRNFAVGNLKHKIEVTRKDEIGVLAKSFNAMAEEILEKTRKLVRAEELAKEIASRKQAQEALLESEEKFRTIAASAHDAIIMADDVGEVSHWNKAAEEIFGYSVAEVAGKALHKLIIPQRHHKDYLNGLERFRETGQGPVIGKTSSWMARRKDGTEFPIELSLSTVKLKGRWNAIGIVRDITQRKQAEEELTQTMKKLRKALGGTIRALASTVEKRDPYTAGHQERVANLARAIATEMGLSKEQIDTIRMAGLVHDIGKVSVPAEILSRPGRLTKTEFDMIKTHPQVGYDILKGIDFPWPVAQVVLQHQERMDGSGYPKGLTGEKILLEAKILAVADVVEAMSSHRPYRPALGIDRALEEISKNRGVLYDANVVDACVRLFTEKGFKF